MRYEGTGAYAAVVAERDRQHQDRSDQVNEVWAAQDCGICLNPDGMLNQAQGCCIQGISRTLHEELKLEPDGHRDRRLVHVPDPAVRHDAGRVPPLDHRPARRCRCWAPARS